MSHYKNYVITKFKELDQDKKYHGLSRDGEYEVLSTENNTGVSQGLVPMTEEEKKLVENLPHVKRVVEDGTLSTPDPIDEGLADEFSADDVASLDFINVPDVWGKATGKGVLVAVLDTGISKEHAESTLVRNIKGLRTFVSDPVYSVEADHGSHCAGIVAGPNKMGVAPDCSLLIGRVLGENGNGSFSGIIKGVEWAVSAGAKVISMSLSGDGASNSPVAEAVNAAVRNGVIVVCAAGNDGCSTLTADQNTPGNAELAISVAAVDNSGTIASFSSCGNTVDVAYPGVRVVSLGQRNVINAVKSGTSMATPHAAGMAALGLELKTVPEVRKALLTGTRDTGLSSQREGSGIGDALVFMNKLGTSNPPAPKPAPSPAPTPEKLPTYTPTAFYQNRIYKQKSCNIARGTEQYGVFRKS